jgi:uncharacterized membrane protein YcaP (DUF421 family)
MNPVLATIDWHAVLVPSGSVPELVLRISLMYLSILAGFRIFRREAGSLSVSDLLVVVLIADAAQNGMAGEYKSLTEGGVAVATIFVWNYALDWLAYRFRAVHWLLHPPPVLLVRNGEIQRRNLRAELISTTDLVEQLREQGIADLHQVRTCHLESDGRMSVVRADGDEPSRRDEGRR